MVAEAGSGNAEMAVHVVTAEEAAAGTYSVHEVLLPLPGYKVALPQHDVAHVYPRVLSEWGLSSEQLEHRVKELALPGSYRRLLQRPLHMSWAILKYDDPTTSLAPTDLSRLRGLPDPTGEPDGERTAVRLEFQLPPSTYATMCLRELTKQSTELSHPLSLNERGELAAAGGAAASVAAGAAAAAKGGVGGEDAAPGNAKLEV